MRLLRYTVAAIALMTAAASAPAMAADDFNGWSCKELYLERNGIYKDGGYCFQTRKAIKTFGNAGCQYDSQSDVPLSANQRKVIKAIVNAERAKRCPR
jgi:YARHG domain